MILGLIVIATPFFSPMSTQATWALVALGLAVAVLSIWGAQETTSEREAGHMHHA